MRKIIILLVFIFLALSLWAGVAQAEEMTRYEYKIVRLGSLSGLQDAKSDGKIRDLEKLLNRDGLQGWDIVNIFAVRTTFDPNVFFVAMKRPLLKEESHEK